MSQLTTDEYYVADMKNDNGDYVVVDVNNIPISYGKFRDLVDARYVAESMNTGKYFGDHISDLCQACYSCTNEI